jgi:hypothetical protein
MRIFIVSGNLQISFTMKQYKHILLLSFLLIQLYSYCQEQEGEKRPVKLSKAECFAVLKSVSGNWAKDSLSKMGVREKFGWDYMGRLDSVRGAQWSEVYGYLGLPDFVWDKGKRVKALPQHADTAKKATFYYLLNKLPRTERMLHMPGALVMFVFVSNRIVEDMYIVDVDG